MNADHYESFAAEYDHMVSADPSRTHFFTRAFEEHGVKSILDCACGTGSDLLLFTSLGKKVTGSDLSDAMIKIAQAKVVQTGQDIEIRKADFRDLRSSGLTGYDAVVCLTSSICEVHSNEDVVKALQSMYNALNDSGILIIDQGQSDAMMAARPRFVPVLNNRDLSRLFVIDYEIGSPEFITVNICDMIHSCERNEFRMEPFRLRIRFMEEWHDLLRKAGIDNYTMYGNWNMSAYDKSTSKRIVIEAVKEPGGPPRK